MSIVAIDVGGTFIKSALISNDRVIELKKRPTPLSGLNELLDVIDKIYREAPEVEGIAMSMPGVLNENTGYMYSGGALQYIHELDFAEIVRARCGVPVTVGNDAKVGAQAELVCGALKGVQDAVIIVLGTGVGGAIVCGGKVLSGVHRFAGELSFLFTPLLGETDINIWGRKGGSARISELYFKQTNITKTPEEIFILAEKNDAKAAVAINQYCDEIAMAATTIQSIIDPEVIAIGGGISQQPTFIHRLDDSIRCLHQRFGLRHGGVPEMRITACQYHNNTMGAYLHYLNMNREGQ